jgi:hypothetical protein
MVVIDVETMEISDQCIEFEVTDEKYLHMRLTWFSSFGPSSSTELCMVEYKINMLRFNMLYVEGRPQSF